MKKTLMSMVRGTLILTLAGMVARVLGFFFKQYLTGQIGAEGMGLIQLTMPISALVQAVYSGGLTSTVSSMVAGDQGRGRAVAVRAMAIGAGSGFAVTGAMWFGAAVLANLVGDQRIADAIRIIAVSVPVIGAGAAIKGYYMGLQQMRYPALAQVLEQVVRIGSSFVLIANLWDMGTLSQAAGLCTIGTALGEVAGFAMVCLPYLLSCRKPGQPQAPDHGQGGLTKLLILRSLPSGAGKLASSLLTVVETALVPVALAYGGMTDSQGLATLGLVEGIAMPLIMLPGMVCTSLSSVAVPAIASAGSDKRQRQERVEMCLQISIALGFIMASIFRGYADLVAYVTYPTSNVAHIIHGLAPCCIFAYPILTMTGTMQALRLQKRQLANSILGYVLRIGLHWVLAGKYGLAGYMLSLIISYGFICVMDIFRVTAYTNLRMGILSWSWLPALCYGVVVVTAPRLSAIIFDVAQGSRLAILAMVAVVGVVALAVACGRIWRGLIHSWSEVADCSGQT